MTTLVHDLGSDHRLNEAIAVGLDMLRLLGLDLTLQPSKFAIAREVLHTKWLLQGRSIESLLRLPPMSDPAALAATQVLVLVVVYAFVVEKDLAPLLACRIVRLTLKHGVTDGSPVGFAVYGALQCVRSVDEGSRLADLSLEMLRRLGKRGMKGRVYAAVYGLAYCWTRPVTQTFVPLREAYASEFASGDLEMACLCGNVLIWNQFEWMTVSDVLNQVQSMDEKFSRFGQTFNRAILTTVWQVMLNHRRPWDSQTKYLEDGDVFDASAMERLPMMKTWTTFHGAMLAYMFGDFELAESMHEGYEELIRFPVSASDDSLVYLVDGLIAAAMARTQPSRQRIRRLRRRLSKVTKWATYCPHNFLGKQYLLEAELASLRRGRDGRQTLKQHRLAQVKYASAIAVSQKYGLIIQTALAYECAARHADPRHHLTEARRVYEEWGSQAKVDHVNHLLQQLDEGVSL